MAIGATQINIVGFNGKKSYHYAGKSGRTKTQYATGEDNVQVKQWSEAQHLW